MIAGLRVWNDLHLRAPCTRFFGDDCANAVHRGFLMGRGFGLDETFEKRFFIHYVSLEQAEDQADQANHCTVCGKDIEGVLL